MKILIISSSYDYTVDYFIDKYKSKVEFYRLNTDLIYAYEININIEFGWTIACDEWCINQNDIYSIYYRKPAFPDLSEYEPIYHKLIQRELLAIIQGIPESFNGICLTRPSILSASENKIKQLSLAKEIGFIMPQSLITNSANNAKRISSEFKCIVKPLSLGKIISEGKVGIIQTNYVDNTYEYIGLEIMPSYFQEYIPKDYELRVTIVDREVFAVRINSSNKLDWRSPNSSNTYSIVTLPERIKLMCYAMLKELELSFGAFDFIVRNDRYYFLEVNPNGQWYWLEKELNLNISDYILKILMEGNK